LLISGLLLALIVTLAWLRTPQTRADENVRIDSPANGDRVIGKIEVRGRATTADPSQFSFYRLYYGAGSSPTLLRPIGSSVDTPVDDGLLGTWDTAPLFQGEYTLQLSVYDTAGGNVISSVVVTILPAPTPTSRNLPQIVVPQPSQTPNPDDDTGPTATPLPELPQLVPNIPQIVVPQQDQSAPPIMPAQEPANDPGYQPIQIDQGQQPSYQPPPIDSGQSNPIVAPTIDTSGGSTSPQFNPINPSGAPPVPVIVPNEPPPPTLNLPPTPTLFGLPP
jgi:hypothetical protein